MVELICLTCIELALGLVVAEEYNRFGSLPNKLRNLNR